MNRLATLGRPFSLQLVSSISFAWHLVYLNPFRQVVGIVVSLLASLLRLPLVSGLSSCAVAFRAQIHPDLVAPSMGEGEVPGLVGMMKQNV